MAISVQNICLAFVGIPLVRLGDCCFCSASKWILSYILSYYLFLNERNAGCKLSSMLASHVLLVTAVMRNDHVYPN